MHFNAYRGQNRASESHELKLEAVESSPNAGARNQTCILGKGNKHSLLRSHLSSPVLELLELIGNVWF